MSDVPGDPGSQLPYQEFSPYYLAPIWLGFPLEIQLGLGAFLSLSLSLVLAHNGRALRGPQKSKILNYVKFYKFIVKKLRTNRSTDLLSLSPLFV